MLQHRCVSALQARQLQALGSATSSAVRTWNASAKRGVPVAFTSRRMTIKLGVPTGTKKRSIEEQLKKLKEQKAGDGADSPAGTNETAQRHDGSKGGTMTLAMRLSQSLKDPLRSKDFLGQVTKGEIQVECHHHSKFLWLKNQKGLLSADAIANLIELIQISDSNWYERFGVLKGGEASFCGGSDVRALAAMGLAAHEGPCPQMEAQRGQYELCHLIAKSPKTRVAILDGNCLGAGTSLALAHTAVGGGEGQGRGGQHCRVATDRTVFSLQHAHFLGMFPGCGLSFFLPRLRGHLGMYLALTGAKINGADCLFAGVATHFMAQHKVERCLQAITQAPADITEAQLHKILEEHTTTTEKKEFKTYSTPPSFPQRYGAAPPDPTHLEDNFDAIQRCFGAGSVAEVLEGLAAEDSEWARRTEGRIRDMAPLALHLTFRLLRQSGAASSTLEEALRTEWRLARRCFALPDFFEAVRALMVDKDGSPQWAPFDDSEQVSRLFAPMGESACRPLELSQQHLKSPRTIAKGQWSPACVFQILVRSTVQCEKMQRKATPRQQTIVRNKQPHPSDTEDAGALNEPSLSDGIGKVSLPSWSFVVGCILAPLSFASERSFFDSD